MRNKNGFVPPVVIVFWALFGVITVVAAFNIPKWTKAKAAHCEAAYQAGNVNCGYVK